MTLNLSMTAVLYGRPYTHQRKTQQVLSLPLLPVKSSFIFHGKANPDYENILSFSYTISSPSYTFYSI